LEYVTDNVKVGFKEVVGCEGVDWIQLDEDRIDWRDIMNKVKNLRVVDLISDYPLFKKNIAPWSYLLQLCLARYSRATEESKVQATRSRISGFLRSPASLPSNAGI
jgi:hypothetical protein